jgi:hypothetical protein
MSKMTFTESANYVAIRVVASDDKAKLSRCNGLAAQRPYLTLMHPVSDDPVSAAKRLGGLARQQEPAEQYAID